MLDFHYQKTPIVLLNWPLITILMDIGLDAIVGLLCGSSYVFSFQSHDGLIPFSIRFELLLGKKNFCVPLSSATMMMKG
jgi:hypothetical protein